MWLKVVGEKILMVFFLFWCIFFSVEEIIYMKSFWSGKHKNKLVAPRLEMMWLNINYLYMSAVCYCYQNLRWYHSSAAGTPHLGWQYHFYKVPTSYFSAFPGVQNKHLMGLLWVAVSDNLFESAIFLIYWYSAAFKWAKLLNVIEYVCYLHISQMQDFCMMMIPQLYTAKDSQF